MTARTARNRSQRQRWLAHACASPAPATAAAPAAACAPLQVNIRRLTLPAYTPLQQQRFTQALQHALSQLRLPSSSQPTTARRVIGQLDGGVVRAGAGPQDTARAIAAQIAAALQGRSTHG
jgi:ABC-type nitrate/sulfonate/bicarbonate transport system substrate-binding protein